MIPVIGILAHPPYEQTQNPYSQIGYHYTNAIYKAGGLPIIIPQIDNVEIIQSYVKQIDGLLIPGGIDVNPFMYNENPLPKLGNVNMEYDIWEMHMIVQAKQKQIPILGICRGLQILNVFHGGTLWQDLSYRKEETFLHKQTEQSRSGICHYITTTKDSYLQMLLGEHVAVNSFHHQAIKQLASNFLIEAIAEDGIIEAIVDPSYPYLRAVQWHPEGFEDTNDTMQPLFIDFIEACKKELSK